jgi:hypothetical protein
MRRRDFVRSTLGAAGSFALAPPALAQREPPPLLHEGIAAGGLAATVAVHYVTWLSQASWSFTSTWPVLHDPAYPLPRGYDSTDPLIIRRHNQIAARHGFVWLWSWWGRSARVGGDAMLRLYLESDPDSPVPLMILYEATGLLQPNGAGFYDFDDPLNFRQLVDDLAYLDRTYWRNPRYAHRFHHIDGRPVVFPWVSRNFVGAWPAAVRAARGEASFYLVGSELSLDLEADGVTPRIRADLADVAAPLDAVSTYGLYDPRFVPPSGELDAGYAERVDRALRGWAERLATVAPDVGLIPPLQFAYDDRYVRPNRRNPTLVSDGTEAIAVAQVVRALIDDASVADPRYRNVLPVVFLVSWNEHFEGSAIEWTDEHGYTYVLATTGTFRASTPGRGSVGP